MNKKESTLQSALTYFRQPGFTRLFEGFKERFISLGHVGGTVVLNPLKPYEKDVLEGFFQIDCHKRKSLTVSVERMERALKKTKFSAFTLKELLEAYFADGLVSKKEQREQEEEDRNQRFQHLLAGYTDTRAGKWLQQILDTKQMPYTLLKQDEGKENSWLEKNIPYLLQALELLPVWKEEKTRLPVFASKITGNPHYFDEGNRMFRYLLYGICEVCDILYPSEQSAEQKAEILYQAGILKDDISNFVTCIGIRGLLKGGRYHPGMEGFYMEDEMMQLNLYHLGQLEKVETEGKEVYVVENPAIFQLMIEHRNSRRYQQIKKRKNAAVCANGQLRLAVLVLLDLLVRAGCMLWYAGDFDPEGLMIAQKLKDRYGEQLTFWHYEKEDYERAKSVNDVLSEKRKKQLEKLSDPVLLCMKEWILESGVAGYQENICEVYVNEEG